MNFFKRIFNKIKDTINNITQPIKKQYENYSIDRYISKYYKNIPILYVEAKDYEKKFLSSYSYVVKYYTVGGEEKYITITSSKELSYYDVLKEAINVVKFGYDPEDLDKYGDQADYTSFEVLIGVINK